MWWEKILKQYEDLAKLQKANQQKLLHQARQQVHQVGQQTRNALTQAQKAEEERAQQQRMIKADADLKSLVDMLTAHATLEIGKIVVHAGIEAAITASLALGTTFGVKNWNLGHVATVKKLVFALERVILDITVYEFWDHQIHNFRGLDLAAREGKQLMESMLARLPKLRETLVTILTTLDRDRAVQFLRDLIDKVPAEVMEVMTRNKT
jgi:hypothetical protein